MQYICKELTVYIIVVLGRHVLADAQLLMSLLYIRPFNSTRNSHVRPLHDS